MGEAMSVVQWLKDLGQAGLGWHAAEHAGLGGIKSFGSIKKIAVIGDSIRADAWSSGLWTHWGFLAWARRFLGDRVDISSSRLFAVSGTTIIQALNLQLPSALASGADTLWVGTGKNSLGSDTTGSLIAQYKSIFSQALKNGMQVITEGVRTCSGANALTGDVLLQAVALNSWMKEYCLATPGMKFIDPNPVYIDYTSGNAKSGYLRDGLHDNQQSAHDYGLYVANFLSPYLPRQDQSFTWLGDVYDSVKNPRGNLLTNGCLNGTGGTLLNGATGTTPTGWRGYRSTPAATHTAAFAVGTDSANVLLPRCALTLGGTGDVNSSILDQQLDITSVSSAGDVVFAQAEIDLTCASGFVSFYLSLQIQDASYTQLIAATDGWISAGNGTLGVVTGEKYYLRTDPIVVPAGFKYAQVSIVAVPQQSGTPSAVIGIERVSLRKVIAP